MSSPVRLAFVAVLTVLSACSTSPSDPDLAEDAGGTTFDAGPAPAVDAAAPDASPDAKSPCGNGKKDPGEACDDGNTHDGDGCSATCTLESAFASDV